jgi:hypothetical protein
MEPIIRVCSFLLNAHKSSDAKSEQKEYKAFRFVLSLSLSLSLSLEMRSARKRALSLSLFADERFCGDFLWAQKTEKVFVMSRTRNKQRQKKRALARWSESKEFSAENLRSLVATTANA